MLPDSVTALAPNEIKWRFGSFVLWEVQRRLERRGERLAVVDAPLVARAPVYRVNHRLKVKVEVRIGLRQGHWEGRQRTAKSGGPNQAARNLAGASN